MHAHQEHVDSLKYFNYTVFLITPIYLSILQLNMSFVFIEAARVSTPYRSPSLLDTVNQMSRFVEAPYEQYTRQDHPMENPEQMRLVLVLMLMIFNEGAYLTFKSILHKALNLF